MKRKPKLTIFKDKRGEYRWNFKSRNGRIIAASGEGYKTLSNAKRALRQLRLLVSGNHEIELIVNK